MKGLLLTGAALIAYCGLMTGCSHDDMINPSVVEGKRQAFQEVFVGAYGKIDPKQDWGFGTVGTQQQVSAARHVTRAIEPQFDFPSAPAASDYKTARDGQAELCTGYQSGHLFYIDASVNASGATIQPYVNWDDPDKDIVLYVEGDVRPTDIYTPGGTTIYLLPGSKLTIPANRSSFSQDYTHIYIAEGAELIVQGDQAEFAHGVSVYNKGKITADSIVVSNNGLLYNQGTIDIPGKIRITNGSSVVVNDNTIKAAYLGTEGSAHFQNNANATISGLTLVNSNGNTWVNNGTYRTGNFTYNATSSDVINNCRLYVSSLFEIRLAQNASGSFQQDADGYTETSSFVASGPANIILGEKSYFNVKGTATMDITVPDFGIIGPESGDYAVFQADRIDWAERNNFCANYFQNLYVVAGYHFALEYLDGDSDAAKANGGVGERPTYSKDGQAQMYIGGVMPAYTIDASTCSPGFPIASAIEIPTDQSETTEDQITVVTTVEHYETRELIEQGRVFCEDLGQISTNDMDFNDVVFDAYVYKVTPSTRTIVSEDGVETSNTTSAEAPYYETTIVLLAAGGTLQLSLAGVEVHNALGGHQSFTIVNTVENDEGAYGNDWSGCSPVLLGTGFSYASIVEIPVVVRYGNGEVLELSAEQGWAPHKILVPIGTKWCKERVNIADAYTNFHDYVGSSQNFWEGSTDADKLYTHPMDTYQPRGTEAVTALVKTDGPTTTYRNKGTSSTSGGYQGEEVLSRRLRLYE